MIELALRGTPVCLLADLLAMPDLRPEPVPAPRVVDHLISALATAPPGQRVKRVLDVVLAGLGLLAALPLFVLVAAAIRAESPGPVLFVQERLGRLRAQVARIDLSSCPRGTTIGRGALPPRGGG